MLQFAFFGLVFLGFGVGIQIMSDQIVELEVRYDEKCKETMQTGVACNLKFSEITERVTGPIYVYYELGQFYQNHRRYIKSRNDAQLAGNYLNVDELSSCDPIITVGDLWTN